MSKDRVMDYILTGSRQDEPGKSTIDILGKTADEKYVLVGGLGFMGVGRMIYPNEDRYKAHPDYATAPIIEVQEKN